MEDVSLRAATAADLDRVLDVARSLPAWFTERGLTHMRADVPFQRTLLAESGGDVVGFVAFFSHEGVGRIGWMGVRKDLRRGGVGRALVEAWAKELAAAGVTRVLVDTLGDAVEYEPYAETRAFYRAVGFRDLHRVEAGDPECPEQLTLARDLVAD